MATDIATETKQVTTFGAADIHCEGCATAIRRALAKVPGVDSVEVDINSKLVRVAHSTAAESVASALERAGFPTTLEG